MRYNDISLFLSVIYYPLNIIPPLVSPIHLLLLRSTFGVRFRRRTSSKKALAAKAIQKIRDWCGGNAIADVGIKESNRGACTCPKLATFSRDLPRWSNKGKRRAASCRVPCRTIYYLAVSPSTLEWIARSQLFRKVLGEQSPTIDTVWSEGQ